jgi:hypothetical protein
LGDLENRLKLLKSEKERKLGDSSKQQLPDQFSRREQVAF